MLMKHQAAIPTPPEPGIAALPIQRSRLARGSMFVARNVLHAPRDKAGRDLKRQ